MIISTTKSFKSKLELSRASNNKIPGANNDDGYLNEIVWPNLPPNRRFAGPTDVKLLMRGCVYRISR